MLRLLDCVDIPMGLDCEDQACRDFAGPLYLQLSSGGYDRCSVMPFPHSLGEWKSQHRTARKRANRCAKLGYLFAAIERERFSEDIYAINTSLDERQGRPMSASYRQPVEFSPLEQRCDRHRVTAYGVLQGIPGLSALRLVAYLWLYRSGDLALVSSILGHGEHLQNDVMYLLMQGVIGAEIGSGGVLVYNRHDSGTDGLRYYKERVGFVESSVRWAA